MVGVPLPDPSPPSTGPVSSSFDPARSNKFFFLHEAEELRLLLMIDDPFPRDTPRGSLRDDRPFLSSTKVSLLPPIFSLSSSR